MCTRPIREIKSHERCEGGGMGLTFRLIEKDTDLRLSIVKAW